MVQHKDMRTIINEDSGVTLIELLAALAILAIIITSFLAFFIQSARTASSSSDINEATFLAQQEMEDMVYHSSSNSFPPGFEAGVRSNYKAPYTIMTRFKEIDESSLYAVIVEVFEGDADADSAPKAKMENRLPFDGTEEDD